ncbi:Scr1 family TA system antitoxin-like transcriptional regulator [Streptomyces microflavus]|uniref:Scr1 family TA system antitoxin-like transcriptional regulator n=1 Tax=Streptomyces microflavus TaxID=1919 RepID=UPI0033F2FEE2
MRIIIDEYGLRRQVGSAKVWEAQLEHPIAIAQLPMVGVRPQGPRLRPHRARARALVRPYARERDGARSAAVAGSSIRIAPRAACTRATARIGAITWARA